MKNLDLTKILKAVPEGTMLYSTIHGNLWFDGIDYDNTSYSIKCKCNGYKPLFTKEGKYIHNLNGECMLFPSKEQRDWSKFGQEKEFKLGDVIYNKTDDSISIYIDEVTRLDVEYQIQNEKFELGIVTMLDDNYQKVKVSLTRLLFKKDYRLATNKEKELFYNKLQKEGYFWNGVTNSLEKYNFKVGDKIQNIYTKDNHEIVNINHDYYILENNCCLKCSDQNNYIKEKFDITTLKPYDKVLVRLSNSDKWTPQIFSYLETSPEGHYYEFVLVGDRSAPQCIPYEGNEHLVRTYKNCDDYYKTWK